jgi:hypothetical protein
VAVIPTQSLGAFAVKREVKLQTINEASKSIFAKQTNTHARNKKINEEKQNRKT